jgi:hypothetical protein
MPPCTAHGTLGNTAPKVIHVGTTLITKLFYSFGMMLFEVIGWRKTNMIHVVAEI